MFVIDKSRLATLLLTVGLLVCACGPTEAAVRIEGQVQAGGGPLGNRGPARDRDYDCPFAARALGHSGGMGV
jgi:hypothetical protein